MPVRFFIGIGRRDRKRHAKSNHTRWAQSCRGEAFANHIATEQTAFAQMLRPYAIPCAQSQCFVARFSSLSVWV
jgi:hypothetical protein